MNPKLLTTAGRTLGAAAALVLLAGTAEAHTGVGATSGFAAGLSHPIFGADHLLVMVGVGLWAGLVGGRALWAMPVAFVSAMLLGAGLGMAAIGLPGVELMIAGSVVALGAVLALRPQLPMALAIAGIALAAIFHGHAHAMEMPATASGLAYFAGFTLATAGLHIAGLALGFGFRKVAGPMVVRAAGAAIAATGLGLIFAG
ncbi:MAG: HupE/UreJ family protein [Rhodospirillaceae bacterium]|nr:HupE/UreJ family protein [Rhodospirillaceae bacterium]